MSMSESVRENTVTLREETLAGETTAGQNTATQVHVSRRAARIPQAGEVDVRVSVYFITLSNRVCETPSMMVQLRHNPVHPHPFKQQKEMLVSFYTLHDIFLNFFLSF